MARWLCWLAVLLLLVVPAGAAERPGADEAWEPYPDIRGALSGLSYLSSLWPQGKSAAALLAPEPDLVYEYRIAELNRVSPIPMRFHPIVRRYIGVYTEERRDQVEQMLALAEYYFPLFRQELDASQLPLELVYLSVVESALNPLALSPSGAVGLWQFKIGTAEMFNLHVDSFLDDRMDPVLSTRAACAYLRYLYRMFGDWHLVLAAYNVGPGAVRRAIERAGGERDYWKLMPALPVSAQNYVPAFIAAAYVFRHAKDHHLKAQPPSVVFRDVDTVRIAHALSFEPLAAWTKVSVHLLHFLNPRYKLGYIPKPDGEPYPLVLPTSAMSAFLQNEDRIYAQSYKVTETPFPRTRTRSMRHYHVVKPGEFLHKIAVHYGCTPAELKAWNPSVGDLHPGTRLQVWLDPEVYASLRLASPAV